MSTDETSWEVVSTRPIVPPDSAEAAWAEAAERITAHLTAVWGWPEDEPEATVLGEQLASSLWGAVSNTNTRPLVLLDALLTEKPHRRFVLTQEPGPRL